MSSVAPAAPPPPILWVGHKTAGCVRGRAGRHGPRRPSGRAGSVMPGAMGPEMRQHGVALWKQHRLHECPRDKRELQRQP